MPFQHRLRRPQVAPAGRVGPQRVEFSEGLPVIPGHRKIVRHLHLYCPTCAGHTHDGLPNDFEGLAPAYGRANRISGWEGLDPAISFRLSLAPEPGEGGYRSAFGEANIK